MRKDEWKSRDWKEEFESFLNAGEVQPPAHVTEAILTFVHRDLNPSVWLVLSKLAALQAVLGGISLMICSQFGVGSGQLIHVFARLGDNACMALCGALFLGLGSVAAGLLMSAPEVRLIRKSGYLPILLMGIMALGIFFGFGAEIVVGLAFVWLLGGFIAGMLAIEAAAQFRLRVAHA